jgi:hypothetical protein
MRFLAVLLAWAFSTSAHADVGVGAAVGNEDETILFPIRLTSMLIEPYLGYRESDVEFERNISTAERLEVGVGVFGLLMRGENLSMYYGARLADISAEEFVQINEPNTFPETQTDIDGYRVTPTIGFQYTVSRVMIGAEIGLTYEEIDTTSTTIRRFSGVTTRSEQTLVSKGTHANVVFRFFF